MTRKNQSAGPRGPELMKGELHFTRMGDGFICRELVELPKKFAKVHSVEKVREAIKVYLTDLRSIFELRYPTKEEHDAVTKEERVKLAGPIFDDIVKSICVESLSLFQQFMFWTGDWWYYNPTLRSKCSFDQWSNKELFNRLAKEFVLVLLPEQVQKQVEGMEAANTAVAYGHFAILFSDKDQKVRRIITDTELFELHDAYGYVYLDITAEGKPVARFVTSRGGERAFFDGVHLMSHDTFQTCAPKTVVVKGGYKVNSTNCTIVNGILFPLIESGDAVAKTTGAFMGMCDFSSTQAIESFALSEATGTRLKINGTKVLLDEKELKPIGVFQPASVHLLDSGFALYDWSDFHEVLNYRFDSVLVVDDSKDWIRRCRAAFGADIPHLKEVLTSDRKEALKAIVEGKPEVVILDMHLTETEGFEGLWIANQALASGFDGRIVIASGYPDEQLQAMTTLIKGKVWAPGKNIERIRKLLCSTKWN